MVAVFTGSGFGVETGSAWVLGGRGQLGDASFNRYGENVYVNAATGNLVISRTDEILIGRGPDDVLTRTYNSKGSDPYNHMGAWDGTGDRWQESANRYVVYSGSYSSTPQSGTVTLYDWDGSEVVYTWDANYSAGGVTGAFVSKSGPGAYDWMTCAQSGSDWIWTRTDADNTLVQDKYNVTNGGRIVSTSDSDGNTVSFTYTANQLYRVTTANGDYTEFTWTNNNLIEIGTHTSGGTLLSRRVTYGYDNLNRLSTVTVDLTPTDTNDSSVITTTYGYTGPNAQRINSIDQTGGGHIAVTYDSSKRVQTLTVTSASGVTRQTQFTYNTGSSTITDADGNATTLYYDGSNQLTQIDYPTGQTVSFSYDTDGNVVSATDGLAHITHYKYDNHGNCIFVEDAQGNVVERVFDSMDHLQVETHYLTPDPDKDYLTSNPGPSAPVTTRYTYDSFGHLHFAISAVGNVTEYTYSTSGNDDGCCTKITRYPEATKSLAGLGPYDPITESAMVSWASGQDKTKAAVSTFGYDTRGQLTGQTGYASSDSNGIGTGSSSPVTFTFDQYGLLKQRAVGSFSNTNNTYDGLGRLLTSVDPTNTTTITITYTDGTNTTEVVLANGLHKVSTYNRAGELISYAESGTGFTTETTQYKYDSLGQLTMVIDAAGVKSYILYDSVGRKVADISTVDATTREGVLVEYVYDADNRLIRTIRYQSHVTQANMDALSAANGNLDISTVRPTSTGAENEWRFYDLADRVTAIVDGDGDVTGLAYDGAGQLVSTTQYATRVDVSGWTTPSSFTLPTPGSDIVTREYYDADGRVIGSLGGNGSFSTNTYDHAGHKIETVAYATLVAASDFTDSYATLITDVGTSSDDLHTRYYYDGRDYLIYVVDPELHPVKYVYDSSGNLINRIDYTGVLLGVPAGDRVADVDAAITAAGLTSATTSTQYTFDALGHVTMVTDALGYHTYYLYDAGGRKVADISTADTTGTPEGVIVEYVYDVANRLIRTIRYQSHVTAANMTALLAAGGNMALGAVRPSATNAVNEWRFYDLDDRLTGVVDGDGDTTVFAYDAVGNLVTTTQYANKVNVTGWTTPTTFTAPTADTARDVVTRNFYDDVGRLVGSLNGNGAFSQIIYDSAGLKLHTISYANLIASSHRGDTYSQLVTLAGTNGDDLHTRYYYDGAGQLIYMVDALLHPVKYVYDGAGNVINRIDYTGVLLGVPAGNQVSDVDAAIAAAGLTDTGARRAWFVYNGVGHLAFSIDATGAVTQFTYDPLGNVAKTVLFTTKRTTTSSPSLSTMNTWSGNHVGDSGNRTTRSLYDVDNRLAYTVDGLGYVTKFEYDADGRMWRQTQLADAYTIADGATVASVTALIGTVPSTAIRTTFTYDPLMRLGDVLDDTGVHTAYTYDSLGRVQDKTVASGTSDARKTAYTYDNAGNVKTESTMNGSTVISRTDYTYDGTGRLTIKTMAANDSSIATTTTYDVDRTTNIATQVDTSGQTEAVTTRTVYDAFGNISDKTEAYGTDPVTTHFDYDANGRLVTETRGSGNDALVATDRVATAYLYDAFGEVTDMTVASGTVDASTTHYTYDADGRMVTTTIGYNDSSLAAAVTYNYNTFGNVSSIDDARGYTKSFSYDADGRETFETDPVTLNTYKSVIGYQYDAFGNVIKKTTGLSSTTDTGGNATYYFYDKNNRLRWTVDSNLFATETTYTAAGEIKTVKHYVTALTSAPTPGGAFPSPTLNNDAIYGDALTQFEYDAAGRLTKVTDALGNYEQYTPDALGRRTDVRNKLGGTTHYVFDHLGRVTSETLPVHSVLSNGTDQASTVTNTYTYDHRGNRKSMTEASGLLEQRTTAYDYDSFNRVVTTTYPAIAVIGDPAHLETVSHVSPQETFQYDRRGNLIMHTDTMSGRTVSYFNILDRKTDEVNAAGTLSQWTYDPNGNMTVQKVYDTAVTVPTDPRATKPTGGSTFRETDYAYNRANWLTTTTVSSVLTGEYGSSYTTTTGSITITNTYDRMGNVIRQQDGRGNYVNFYYDKVGHKTYQIDQLGYVTKYDYDSNGNVKTETRYANPTTTTISLADNVTLSPADPSTLAITTSADDRITNFTYDKNGNRLTESRLNVVAWTVDDDTDANNGAPGSLHAAPTTSTITYTYNGLGEVTSKTEATGNAVTHTDTTTYTYDAGGRQTQVTGPDYKDSAGNTLHQVVGEFYDGLNNLTRTVRYDGDSQTTTGDRVTTYKYDYEMGTGDHGGRLTVMTDANGKAHTYYYDRAGRMVLDKYQRTLSNGSTVTEGSAAQYDLMGRAVLQYVATYNGTTWSAPGVAGDVSRTHYNTYGEVDKRGMNFAADGTTPLWQENFFYDNAGHMWKATAADGTTHLYIYDKNGSQTMDISSSGAALGSGLDWSTITVSAAITALTTAGSTWAAPTAGGMTLTETVYDKRGQSTATREVARQLSYDPATQTYTTATIVHGRAYNAFGEVIEEIDPRAYDSAGVLNTTEDQTTDAGYFNHRTDFLYNTMGRIVEQDSPLVSYTDETGTVHTGVRPAQHNYYDASGRLVGVDDANGHRNTRTLLAGTGVGDNEEPQVLKEFHADGGVYKRWYDIFGDMVTTVDENTKTETYIYDKMDRLTEQDHQARSDGTQLKDYYGYDELGHRTSHYNSQLGSGVKETTDYDVQGRLTSMVDFGGYTTTYSYGWHGDYVTDVAGTTSDWALGGWLKTTTNAAGRQSTEQIDFFGRTIARTDFGDNPATSGTDESHHYTMAFDYAGRALTSTASGGGIGTPVVTTYGYFNSGKAKSATTGSAVSTYAYDKAGNLAAEKYVVGSTTYEDATMMWDALNRMQELNDNGPNNLFVNYPPNTPASSPIKIRWDYDLNGNIRRMRAWYNTINSGGAIGTSYTATAPGVDPTVSPGQDYWYTYDAMDRFLITKGTLVSGAIALGTYGTRVEYDQAGQRTLATRITDTWSTEYPYHMDVVDTSTEHYAYTADGYLSDVHTDTDVFTNGTNTYHSTGLTASYARDKMGRVTNYHEYTGTTGSEVERYSRAATYGNKSQVTTDTTISNQTDGKVVTVTNTYDYNADLNGNGNYNDDGAASYMGGVVTHEYTWTHTDSGSDHTNKYTHTRSSFAWWDSAQTSLVEFDPDYDGGTINYANESTYSYDTLGRLTGVHIDDGQPRDVVLINDAEGKVLQRYQRMNGWTQGGTEAAELHYRYGGIAVGDIGNNGTSDVDYAASISQHRHPPPTTHGPFADGSNTATLTYDFDQSYDAVNGLTYESTFSRYTVVEGDTLESIAQQVWGDSSYWYLIADANGLDGSDPLIAGTDLIIPAKVHNSHNTSDVYRVYDPNEAIGDTSPTRPKAPKHHSDNGCGVMGQILLVVVAVAVAALTAGALIAALAPAASALSTLGGALGALADGSMAAFTAAGITSGELIAVGAAAGAAGSIVSQGVGLATGIQSKFDWGAVAMAAVEGGIGMGAGPLGLNLYGEMSTTIGSFGVGVLRGVTTNILTQGIGVATGIQRRFDWTGVAAAGMVSGVSNAVANNLDLPDLGSKVANNAAMRLISGMAGAIAGAGTKTLIQGTDFGDNLIAVLPDVIGSTIGNAISDGMATKAQYVDPNDPIFAGRNGDEIGAIRLQQAADAKGDPNLVNNPTLQRMFAIEGAMIASARDNGLSLGDPETLSKTLVLNSQESGDSPPIPIEGGQELVTVTGRDTFGISTIKVLTYAQEQLESLDPDAQDAIRFGISFLRGGPVGAVVSWVANKVTEVALHETGLDKQVAAGARWVGTQELGFLEDTSFEAEQKVANEEVGWKYPGLIAAASATLTGLAIFGGVRTGSTYRVGPYNRIQGTVPNYDAHHVGQKALMARFIPGYNERTAPAILVPRQGHTQIGPNGVVLRGTQGISSARDVVARDINELRRVYPDIPNQQLQELVKLNKTMYPDAFTK